MAYATALGEPWVNSLAVTGPTMQQVSHLGSCRWFSQCLPDPQAKPESLTQSQAWIISGERCLARGHGAGPTDRNEAENESAKGLLC